MTAFDFLVDAYDAERQKTAAHIRLAPEEMTDQCAREGAWMKESGIGTGESVMPETYQALSAVWVTRLREKPEEWWREHAKSMVQLLMESAEHRAKLAGRPGKGESALRSLQRAPVRVREMATTIAAWQMIIDSERGSGTITLIDVGGKPLYRGEGTYLGWPQEQLASEYQRFNRTPHEPDFELAQLG